VNTFCCCCCFFLFKQTTFIVRIICGYKGNTRFPLITKDEGIAQQDLKWVAVDVDESSVLRRSQIIESVIYLILVSYLFKPYFKRI
jgi:hypothetical protein